MDSPFELIVLDVFGQQLITIFTQICLCFPVTDDALYPGIVVRLTQGLERLSAKFPWVAGQVVNEGSCEGNTGVFKIRPLGEPPRMFVKDLRGDKSMPSMEQLRRAGFPMALLDEDIIAPRRTSSGHPGDNVAEVFQLQVNFVNGGLVLTFLGQHQAMDGIGQGQIMHLFSKACCSEILTEEEISIGNFTPENVVPLLDDSWTPGPELHFQIKPSGSTSPADIPSRPNICTWTSFSFSSSALQALKETAMNTIPPDSSHSYISTDDALSAFIWKHITRARLPRYDSTAKITMARAVDVRRHFGIPSTHPGFMHNMTYHTFPMHQLVTELPLGVIASRLRAAADPNTSTLEYDSRSLGTLISRTPDKARIGLLAKMDMSKDIMLNSWAKLNLYELDFGLGLGPAEAVRRPRFDDAFEGLMYLLPRRGDGEIGLAICLGDDDLEKLKGHEEFARYAVHVG